MERKGYGGGGMRRGGEEIEGIIEVLCTCLLRV